MLMGLAFILVAAGMAYVYDAPLYALLCFVLPCGGLAWFLFMQATQMALIVHENKLEYHFGSARVETQWNNLNSIEIQRSGRRSQIVLMLKNPVKQKVIGGHLDKMLFGEHQVSSITLSDIMRTPMKKVDKSYPTVIDFEKLKKTDFGSDLLEFAPHLFEKGENL